MKLASVLELNGQELWEAYKHEILSKSSGPNDRLPVNRYAIKTINKTWILAGALGVLVLIYLATSLSQFWGNPDIQITSPAEETIVTVANTIDLLGKINANDKLLIDGEEVIVDESGDFKKSYALEPGLNVIEFSVKRILGREIKITKQVIYEPAQFFNLEEEKDNNTENP